MLIGGQRDYAHGNDAIEHVIKNMEYFKWDGQQFFECRPLPKVTDINFMKARRRREAEISFIQDLQNFIAFITAPDQEQRSLVEFRSYEKYRQKFGYFEDDLRLDGITAKDRISDYELFVKGFLDTAMVVEKALSKHKTHNNVRGGVIAAFK